MSNIFKVIARCNQQVPECHLRKALEIDSLLGRGVPFTRLQGAKIQQSQALIRFKLGREWRLVYINRGSRYEPLYLTSRQGFETKIKRR